MRFQDYYKTLGVSRTADENEIRKAYRDRARKLHPDVNKSHDAEERFKAVNEAYQVLSDPEKRAKYDRFGADWERYQSTAGAGVGANDFSRWFTNASRGPSDGPGRVRYEYRTTGGEGYSDFFETLFGSSSTRSRRGRPARRGEDHEYTVEIGLREAFGGTTRTFELQVPVTCSQCRGAGIVDDDVCYSCGGSGSVAQRSKLEVTIPSGIREGQRVRVAGKGSPGSNGGRPGDVYLKVAVRPDAQFSLDQNDLRTDVDVPLYTAVLGGEVVVETLTGKVALTIPPETQNGRVFRLRGQGWTLTTGSTGRGDLLARVQVRIPTQLTDREREYFEKLRTERAPSRAQSAA